MNKPNKRTEPLNKTGNKAIDMCLACIAHYKKQQRDIKYINLSHAYWSLLSDYLKEFRPDFYFEDMVKFGDTTIRKGWAFMKENLEVEMYETVLATAEVAN